MLGSILASILIAHGIGDYWVQTEHQATAKGLPGWVGRRACLAHVATYTLTIAAALAAVSTTQHIPLNPWRVVAGLAVSAVTHYIADRRTPLRRLAIATGKDAGWIDGGGLAHLDQMWHGGWLLVSAITII